MNKKFKIIIGIIVEILLLYLIIFVIDYNRCSNMKEPIFVIKKQTAAIGIAQTKNINT